MAKRFIDTGFFKSPFVRSLQAPLKLFYSFIICDCSASGIWIIDFEAANMFCGTKLKPEDATGFLTSGKAVDLQNGKWFIPGFIEHQYPNGLKRDNRAHIGVIAELDSYGLLDNDLKIIKVAQKDLGSPLQGAKVMVKVMDKEKDMVKDKVNASPLVISLPPTKEKIQEWATEAMEDSGFMTQCSGKHGNGPEKAIEAVKEFFKDKLSTGEWTDWPDSKSMRRNLLYWMEINGERKRRKTNEKNIRNNGLRPTGIEPSKKRFGKL